MKSKINVISLSLLSIISVAILATIVYSCKKDLSCEYCAEFNKYPIANAGADQLLNLPKDTIMLVGSASSDPDGTILAWHWTKISGPASFKISKPSESQTIVRELVAGIYLFELKVTDNDNLSSTDTIQITVADQVIPNHPPIANAGADQTITWPINNLILDGSGSTDPDNNITSYTWTKIAGPVSFNIADNNSVQTPVTNLTEGDYLFELKVTDAGGLVDKDTMQVIVDGMVDIYVAGQLNSLPVYWKNGQVIYLSNGSPNESSSAMTLDGSDLYVTGLEWWDGNVLPRYWKNNNQVLLSNTPGLIGLTSIAVSGGDVYVAGWEVIANGGYVAKYWKNGQAVLLQCSTGYAWANSIAIDGNDIYVAGFDGGVAKYWKNGLGVSLTNGTTNSDATSIIVANGDVYVAGNENNIAKYWKNGQAVSLTTGTRRATANSIVVIGNDVYVAGTEGDNYGMDGGTGSIAKYWKNGTEISLTNGTTYAYAYSITVFENDVYVAGEEIFNSQHIAKYWKNGQQVVLSNSFSGHAMSIIVVRK